MKTYLSIVLFFVLIAVSLPIPSEAQTNAATFEIFSESGRYSLHVPVEWGAATYPANRSHEIRLIGENLVIADTREHFEEWANNDQTDGNVLVVRTFAAAAYQNVAPSSANFDQLVLETHLSAYHEDVTSLGTAVFDNSGEWSTLDLDTANQSIRLTKADHLIYDITFSGDDSDQLNAIADSLTIHDEAVEQFPRDPLLLDEGAFALETEIGWLIADWAEGTIGRPFNSAFDDATTSGIPHYVIISTENDGEILQQLYTSFGVGQVNVDLSSTYIQIASHPFDELFGSATVSLSDEDYRNVFSQMADEINAQFGSIEEIEGLSAPAYSASLETIFGGANRGTLMMVVNNHTVYALTVAMPNDSFDQATVDTILDGVSINSDGIQEPIAVDPLAPPEIESTDTNAEIGLQIGMQAPDFTLPLLDGNTASLSDFRGKTVLLNFWNIYCRPCRTEMPIFEQVYQSRDDVVILAVDFLDDADSVNYFVEEVGLSFPIALDESGSVNHQFGIRAYPTSFIIDPDGIIRSTPRFTSAVDAATVNEWLDTAQ